MQLIEKEMPDNFNLHYYGDVHDGSIFSTQSGFNLFVDTLNSKYQGCKNNYAIDMGDMIEAITMDDPRYSEDTIEGSPVLEQIDFAINKRKKYKDKLITILLGNHELKLWKYGNITEKVCKELNVPYGTYTSKVTFKDKNGGLMFKTYVTHGRKGISSAADDPVRRLANMKLALKRHLKFKAGDCACMIKGHSHKLIVCEPEYELFLTDDGKNISQHYTSWGQNEEYIHPDARWYGNSGSFLKLYREGFSGYAEMAEYDPVQLGWLVLIVRDRKIQRLEPFYIKV